MRILFAAPLLFLLVLFALSNPQPVKFGLWPTDFTYELPLSIGLLLAMAVSFVLGALLLWFSVLGTRFRARRAERAVRLLDAQVAELKNRPTGTSIAPPR